MIADGGNSQRARLERIGDFPNKPTSEEDDDQTDREREILSLRELRDQKSERISLSLY
ncbi:hypothetical protein F2Q68_00009053 [Brassica cretica]|uniref:Uncharacterized protein n=1 Tax=Brassica cretica TaxID=69181 RepID=A0A8S9KW67_BRACR|nr:hypothetical protein F2Q68_00009053 [Brassica cretica]